MRTVDSLPSTLYPDTIAPGRRSMPEEVFVLRLEAYPQRVSKNSGTEGGAIRQLLRGCR